MIFIKWNYIEILIKRLWKEISLFLHSFCSTSIEWFVGYEWNLAQQEMRNTGNSQSIHDIVTAITTVEPPLMDTSRRRTPPISGPLVVIPATYKHYILDTFHTADTFSWSQWCPFMGVSTAYERNHIILNYRNGMKWKHDLWSDERWTPLADQFDILSVSNWSIEFIYATLLA